MSCVPARDPGDDLIGTSCNMSGGTSDSTVLEIIVMRSLACTPSTMLTSCFGGLGADFGKRELLAGEGGRTSSCHSFSSSLSSAAMSNPLISPVPRRCPPRPPRTQYLLLYLLLLQRHLAAWSNTPKVRGPPAAVEPVPIHLVFSLSLTLAFGWYSTILSGFCKMASLSAPRRASR